MSVIFDPFTGQIIDTGSSGGGGGGSPTIGGPVIGADPNAVLVTDSSSNLADVVLADGELLIGATGAAPIAASLTGTPNQITVINGPNSITLSTPQDIGTGSNVQFNNAHVNDLTIDGTIDTAFNPGVITADAFGVLSSDTVLSTTLGGTGINTSTAANGTLLIGNNSGFTLTTLTGTTDQVVVTNASGSITLSLPQSIATTSSPQFANIVLTPSGSLDITGAGGTLAIGTANADIINIGNSGATVNIQGTTFYQNVTDLLVTDKLITLNVGGSAGSGSNSGIQIEENALITAYVDTSADRNSWEFKAPNQTGIATISPGASGFTIDQGSHDPVTLGAVGSSPNANAASLSNQVLTLQPADATNPGVVTTGTQTFAGSKTFSSTITASITGSSGSTTGNAATATALQTPRNINGVSFNGTADITVTADASTLTGTTLNSTVVDSSLTSVGTLVDLTVTNPISGSVTGTAASFTDNLTGDVTSTGMSTSIADSVVTGKLITGFISGAGTVLATDTILEAIQKIDGNNTPIPGDISPTTWSGLANNTANQAITGLLFSNTVSSFEVLMSIYIDATTDLFTTLKLLGTRKAVADWSSNDLQVEFTGNAITGLNLFIDGNGQLFIDIGNITGFSSGTVKFRAVAV